ncbi:MAG: hypothetical protein ABIN05_05410 [candidate division WOR-3 bacterium]
MLTFEDRRKLKKVDFETLKKNFVLGTLTIEIPVSNNRIIYTDSLEKIEENVVYVLEDPLLYKGKVERIDFSGDHPIFNRHHLVFKEYESDFFYIHSNSLILKFDIFALIYSSIFKEFQFTKRDDFEKVKLLRKKPYLERILLEIGKTVREFFLKKNGYYLEIQRREPFLLLTFDVDRIRYFDWKKDIYYGIKKNFFKDEFSSQYFKIKKNCKTKDPWDRIGEIQKILEENCLKATFYIFAKKKDIFTTRYSYKESEKLFKKLIKKYVVGLHLSYESFLSENMIMDEVEKFKSITDKESIDVRFHFLNRLTEKHVEIFKKLNIKTDSSIGDRKSSSFFTGFANPVFLDKDLVEFPVISMDSALNLEEMRGIKFTESIEQVLIEIKNLKGVFNFIFHPSSLDRFTYEGYSKYLFEIIKLARKKEFKSVSIDELKKMLKQREESVKIEGKSFFVDNLTDYDLKFYMKDKVFVEKELKFNFKEVI